MVEQDFGGIQMEINSRVTIIRLKNIKQEGAAVKRLLFLLKYISEQLQQ